MFPTLLRKDEAPALIDHTIKRCHPERNGRGAPRSRADVGPRVRVRTWGRRAKDLLLF